jgi:hypothetical protein
MDPMTPDAELDRCLAGINARLADSVYLAIRQLVRFAKSGSKDTIVRARQGILQATQDSHVSVRVAACLALRHFSWDVVVESRLRELMASDRKRDVRCAALNALLYYWSIRGVTDENQKMRAHLERKGISRLYHITSERNLASIKECGGILSTSSLHKQIPRRVVFVSSEGSRNYDRQCGTDRWVHLFFHFNQPMFYRTACPDLVILEVELNVVETQPIAFSDENASASRALIGPDLAHLQTLNLEPFGRGSWLPAEKGAWQAEVLVFDAIRWSSITSVQPLAPVREQHRRGVSPIQRNDYLKQQLGL